MNAPLDQSALELIESAAIGEFVPLGKSPSCKTWLLQNNGILVLGFDNSLVHIDLKGNQKKHHGEHQVWGTLHELADHIKAHGENIVVYRDGAFFLVDQSFPSCSVRFRGQKNLVDWTPGNKGVFILCEGGHVWFAPYDKSGAVKIIRTNTGSHSIFSHPKGLHFVSSEDSREELHIHRFEAQSGREFYRVGLIEGGQEVRVCGNGYVAQTKDGWVTQANFETGECRRLFKFEYPRSVRWETNGSGDLLVHQTCVSGKFEFEVMRLS